MAELSEAKEVAKREQQAAKAAAAKFKLVDKLVEKCKEHLEGTVQLPQGMTSTARQLLVDVEACKKRFDRGADETVNEDFVECLCGAIPPAP